MGITGWMGEYDFLTIDFGINFRYDRTNQYVVYRHIELA
jgi:hypothetical protein